MDDVFISCSICGQYSISRLAWISYFDSDASDVSPKEITSTLRSAISHRLRLAQSQKNLPRISMEFVKGLLSDPPETPTPQQQVNRLIRFLGEHITRTGHPLKSFPDYLYAEIGAPNPNMLGDLALELRQMGILKGVDSSTNAKKSLSSASLTLTGWELYEATRKGQNSGNYAFLALQFGDPNLDPLISNHLKPCIKDRLGFDLVDMRDVSQAGVIDNILRAQIRDSAFVIADLTHDNSGAYWEAGYAEGLGKPVIYICESGKFEEARTHFDTNHCTTVMWHADNVDEFQDQIAATIRRSLNLF